MALEGALGKIALQSSRNPRQVLSMDSTIAPVEEKSKVEFTLSAQSILQSIERVYDNILELENLKRKTPEDDALTEWWDFKHSFDSLIRQQKYDAQSAQLWQNLGLAEPVPFR